MSIKKTLVAAAILAGVSGSAIAASGDTARVDNIRWVYDLTIQTYTGDMIITDTNNNIITAGHEFDLATVSPDDLSFPYNFAAPAIMIAQNFTDSNGDGKYDETTDKASLTPVASSNWVINSGVANVVSGGVITPYEGNDLTFRIDTDAGNSEEYTPDATGTVGSATAPATAVVADNTVSVYVKSTGVPSTQVDALTNLSSVFVLGSITATEL